MAPSEGCLHVQIWGQQGRFPRSFSQRVQGAKKASVSCSGSLPALGPKLSPLRPA